MRPQIRALLLLVVVASVLVAPVAPAQAVERSVSAMDDFFSPRTVTAQMGDTVKWTNNGQHDHRIISNQNFFATYLLDPTEFSIISFRTAGRFPYHCQFHSTMTGTVSVPMKKSGAPATGWRLVWSTWDPTPAGRTFDVQVKRPGSDRFEAFRTNTASRTANFNPSTNGSYAFRARTDHVTFHLSSSWSPVLTLSIS